MMLLYLINIRYVNKYYATRSILYTVKNNFFTLIFFKHIIICIYEYMVVVLVVRVYNMI